MFVCSFVSFFSFPVIVLSNPPCSSHKEGEGSEENVVVEVMCLPASGYDLELYTPEVLYRHRPLEAPVSPKNNRMKATGKKKKGFTLLAELQKFQLL